MPRIVPVLKSLFPQSGIVVYLPLAGFHQIRWLPAPFLTNSHPNVRNRLVNSRYFTSVLFAKQKESVDLCEQITEVSLTLLRAEPQS